MFKLWINKIPIFTIPYFQCKICHIDDITVDQAGIHYGHCCSWWLIDLPFVKYFCSLVQLHYSLLSSFIRKQQLAKYHPAVVLDFWSSLQTTFAQPKDFDRLLLTHLRQKDLILLTWIIGIFPLETWNCFRRLGIASWRPELAPEDLFAQQNGPIVELFTRPNRLDEM